MLKQIIKSTLVFLIVFTCLQFIPKKYYVAITGDFIIHDIGGSKYLNTKTSFKQCNNNEYLFKVIVSNFSAYSNFILLIESDSKISIECLNQIFSYVTINTNNKPNTLNRKNSEAEVNIKKPALDLNPLLVHDGKRFIKYTYESPSIYFITIYSIIVSIFTFILCIKKN